MNAEQKQRMEELIAEISKASYAYYVLDDPYMSDMQWDRLYDELRRLESETGESLPDSPTRKVGGTTLEGFREHVHRNRLWSMDKVQSLEELDAWILRTEKLAGRSNLQYYVEYKFDGLTLNLTYDQGELIQAATRGDGVNRHLDAFFYQIGTIDHPPYKSQPEMLDFLRENGFQVSPYLGSGTGREELEECIRGIEEKRSSLDWLIDGVVIKIGDNALREQMGFTEKFPRWAVAYKFEAEEAVTRLLDVTWELGRTGKLTPLAYLEPVDFYGVTVRKATLNNLGDIQRKDVAIGCNVWIRRSNDVIPEIMGRAGEVQPDEKPIEKPEFCPACGSLLVSRGAHLFCMNRKSCRPQAIARITHFASREAMDIEGLSEKTAAQLYDQAGIREPADLYGLTPMDFLMLDGFKEKKAANLGDSLEKSKQCELDAFLFALGIPNVGRKTARDLAQAFGSLENLKNANTEMLTALPDIGDVVAGSITEYFSFPENIAMIDAMLSAGVKPKEPERSGDGVFSGMTIVVTGTLPMLSRKQAEDLIRSCGGNASSSVSKKTAFVVVGEDAGSKLTKAQSLGIETIDEAELMRRAGK